MMATATAEPVLTDQSTPETGLVGGPATLEWEAVNATTWAAREGNDEWTIRRNAQTNTYQVRANGVSVGEPQSGMRAAKSHAETLRGAALALTGRAAGPEASQPRPQSAAAKGAKGGEKAAARPTKAKVAKPAKPARAAKKPPKPKAARKG